jgi:hypothetical protein
LIKRVDGVGIPKRPLLNILINKGDLWAHLRPKLGWIGLPAPHSTLARLLYGVAINAHVRRPYRGPHTTQGLVDWRDQAHASR